ncbi:uncharacterized protein DS421_2g47740 [Arachis hypogaea]|nr:uncharacterized protein DS421_2g47740 [Arachis hypogaea]
MTTRSSCNFEPAPATAPAAAKSPGGSTIENRVTLKPFRNPKRQKLQIKPLLATFSAMAAGSQVAESESGAPAVLPEVTELLPAAGIIEIQLPPPVATPAAA